MKRFSGPPVPALLLAFLSGLAWSLCFGKEPRTALAFVALAPFLLALGARRPLLLGWAFGFAYWLGSASWVVGTVRVFGGLHPALAILCLILMSLYLGSYFALYGALAAGPWKRGGLVALLGLPALWVAVEWLREYLFGGFPWNLGAYAWVELPGMLPLSAWIGAHGVSFLVVFANACLALAFARGRWALVGVGLLLPLTLVAMAGRWSFGPEEEMPVRELRILQPNFPISNGEDGAYWRNYQALIERSREACDREGTLLLWPESATWPFDYGRAEHLRRDLEDLAARGCQVVFNSATFEGEEIYNSALLVGRDGLLDRYDKRRLVPWGEHVPLSDLLPFVDSLARNAGNMTPGKQLELLSWGDEEIGMSICYEVVFPGAVAEQTRRGATFLATVTNDAWYGDTSAPWQHFRAARFRAAENRRPMLRSAITGVSGWIDSRGAVVRSLGVGEEGTLRVQIKGSRHLSPYTRAPWLVPLLSTLLAAFAIFRARRLVSSNPEVGVS